MTFQSIGMQTTESHCGHQQLSAKTHLGKNAKMTNSKLRALVKEIIQEKLKPSMGAGEYVSDFEKSKAPQFKGKSKEKRQKMAVAAYLSAKDKK